MATVPSDEMLVRRGRRAFLAIIVFLLLLDVGAPPLFGEEPEPIRLALTIGLLWAAWRGHGWAIVLLALALALGLLLLVFAVAVGLVGPSLPSVALAALIGLGYAGILVALIFSPSLNRFFKHQEQARHVVASTGARASNRRNVVTLTTSAAELAHQVIADRRYPPETALRIVLATGGVTGIEVEYDLPEEDARDWIGESAGVTLLVSKAIADQVEGLTIDAENGQYVFKLPKGTV